MSRSVNVSNNSKKCLRNKQNKKYSLTPRANSFIGTNDLFPSIIKGQILTKRGYVEVSEISVNDVVIDDNGNDRNVKGIALSNVGNRKVITIGDNTFTDDYCFIAPNGRKCVVDFKGYVQSMHKNVTDGFAQGVYVRNNLIYLAEHTDLRYLSEELEPSQCCYALIVDGADFIQMNGVTVACARWDGQQE